MPRIDPLQLLNCLQVLLSPNGGILSLDEVKRLENLMTKFSKKLVSKCVYVLILKNTETSLLKAFMSVGGWNLIHLWLNDATCNKNWPLVTELLELLVVTPVDVERLKSNNIPKLVKGLSKRDEDDRVQELSNQLVQHWLKIVKDQTQSESQRQQQLQTPVNLTTATTTTVAAAATSANNDKVVVQVPTDQMEQVAENETCNSVEVESQPRQISSHTFYKLTLKDGKHLISKIGASEDNYQVVENVEVVEMKDEDDEVPKQKDRDKEKKKIHEKSARHKSSSSSKSNSSSSRDKDKSRSHKDKHSNSSKDRSKRDKYRSNGSIRSGSSSSSSNSASNKSSSSRDKDKDRKENKEKQAERDRDTLTKLQPQSLQKFPKIPRKADDKEKNKDVTKKEEPKKGTMSVEVRKNNEERPKTVKVYKSKMRSTGLEEEAKPAPPRPTKKPGVTPPIVPPPPPPVTIKRSSPLRDVTMAPPEKKLKIEPLLEKPGAIKLIPPKPKPPVLQESDMFMDALTASATTKKEPKKRKRRASVSKDTSGSPPHSPTNTTTTTTTASITANNNNSVVTSPVGLKNIVLPKFYQETLETDETSKSEPVENEETNKNENGVQDDNKETTEERASTPLNPANEEPQENTTRNNNGLKGVLIYGKRKGPKKSIKWKPDEDLVEVQYFELDENERVNVTKTFGDMAKMDVRGEREAIQMSRKLPNEDNMEVQTNWRIPIEIDLPELLVEPGNKSLEKEIQFAREKSVLQTIYFNRKMLPDAPSEPEPENYQIKDPITIPIEDTENPDHDFRNTPWPEPKGSPPPPPVVNNVPPMFPNMQQPYQNFNMGPPPNFQNIQPFQTPPFISHNVMGGGGGGGGEWNNVNMPNMHNPPMIPRNIPPPDLMNQGPPMNPNMFMQPPDNFNPMMNENPRFPPPHNQFNQQGPGMFSQNNFNQNRGGHGHDHGPNLNHGGFRRGGGNGSWQRMTRGHGMWNNPRGGGPHRGGRICIHYRNKGFCKNRDNCQFFHPNS